MFLCIPVTLAPLCLHCVLTAKGLHCACPSSLDQLTDGPLLQPVGCILAAPDQENPGSCALLRPPHGGLLGWLAPGADLRHSFPQHELGTATADALLELTVQVAAELVEARGLQYYQTLVFRRAMERWKVYATESKHERALAHSLEALAQLRVLQEWRHHLKARRSCLSHTRLAHVLLSPSQSGMRAIMSWRLLASALQARQAMRRLYRRRAFVGWYQRVLFLQSQRHKLKAAAQLLIFGSVARVFKAWYTYTRDVNVKRTIFAQKQAAIKVCACISPALLVCEACLFLCKAVPQSSHIAAGALHARLQEALRVGDQIRARHNAELLEAAFKAWHFQVRYRARGAAEVLSMTWRLFGTPLMTHDVDP